MAAVLGQVPPGGLGLLLDFDGTLAEIVLDPGAAAPRPGSRAALLRLAARADVRLAVISGRSLVDLSDRLGPLPGAWLAGSHGAELRDPGGRVEVLVDAAAARPALEEYLALARGLRPPLRVEDKGQAVAVHTRGLPEAEAAAVREALATRARALEARARVSWIEGKAVYELRARGATKRAGAAALLDRWGQDGPAPRALLCAGDDTTDEELFAEVLARGGLAIRVGPGPSAAPLRLPDPAGVERLLEGLAARLPSAGTLGGGSA